MIHREHLDELYQAIIVQAAMDYGYYMKQIQNPRRRSSIEIAQREIGLIEEFFLSERFKLFTELSGYDILERLKQNPYAACNRGKRSTTSGRKVKEEEEMTKEFHYKESTCDICGAKEKHILSLDLPNNWQRIKVRKTAYDMCESCISRIERTIAQIKRGE